MASVTEVFYMFVRYVDHAINGQHILLNLRIAML